MSRALSVIFAIAWKDALSELRERHAAASMLLFAAMVVVIFSFAVQGPQHQLHAAPGLIWATFIFAGLIGQSRTFGAEEREDCIEGLALCPVSRHLIYLGKLLAAFILMLLMEGVVLVLFVMFIDLPVASLQLLAAVCVLGTLGFCAIGTLLSAVSLGGRARETLLPVLAVPIILPLMIFAVNATQQVLSAQPDLAIVRAGLQYLAALAVLYTTISALMFEYVLGD